MKAKSYLVALSLIALFLAATSARGQLRKWNQQMQELGKTFTALLPDLVGPVKPGAKARLEKGSKELEALAHKVNLGPGAKANALPPEADPTLGFISDLFEREVRRARRSLAAGEVEHARDSLRRTAGFCIACHTRHDQGPDFPTFEVSPAVEKLSPMERGQLFAALRQFDRALEEFERVAGDVEAAKKRPFEWARAVRYALTIAVRVKGEPALAERVVARTIQIPDVPTFFREDVASWKKAVAEWKADPDRETRSEEELYREASRLIELARNAQEYPLDKGADVHYLRASAAAHKLLVQYPRGKRGSEALLLAGDAYVVLDDPMLSPLPELYYEACIRNTPRTPVAHRCFQRYEETVFFGYSGSGGTFIPDDVRVLMNELRKLAPPAERGR